MRTHRALLIALVAQIVVGALPVAAVEPAGSGAAQATSAPAASEVRSFTRVIVRPLRLAYSEEFLADDLHRKEPVRGKDLERIRRYYQEIVEQKLTPDFESTRDPGPGVAEVDAVLIDHSIDKDDWNLPTQVNFRGAPEVRIVAFLRDSESGEAIDTVGLTLRPQPGRLMKSSPGFYWDFMQKVFDRLATRMRWSLEDRHSLE